MAINPLPLAGVGVAAVAVAGGLYFGGTGKEVTQQEIKWHSLSEDSDYSNKITQGTGDYHGKYGQTYGRYLTGINSENDDWWEDALKNAYDKEKATVEDKFTKGLTTKEALRNKCLEAYKLSATDTTGDNQIKKEFTASDTKANHFLESNIWKFCSPAKTKIQTVKEVANETYTSSSSDTFGSKSGNDDLLVSVTSVTDGNNWFWNAKEKELSKHNFDSTNAESAFKKLKEKTGKTAEDTVRKTCEKAYKAEITSSGSENKTYPKAEVGKFCSLSGAALS